MQRDSLTLTDNGIMYTYGVNVLENGEISGEMGIKSIIAIKLNNKM